MPENEQIVVDDNTPVPQLREAFNRANERATANAEAASQVPRLQRENALLRAGGDPDSRVGRLLLSDDEVDWTNRESVTAAWTEVSPPTQAPTPPVEEPASQEAIERQERGERLQSGAVTPGQEPTPHPADEMHRIYLDGRRKNLTRERAAAPALDYFFEQAAAGDERILYDPSVPYSEQWDPR